MPTAKLSLRLVKGPSAWIGAELARHSEQWIYSLSPAELGEIEANVERLRGRDLASLGKDDFVLPVLGPVLDRLRDEVLNGRGFVLMRGLPVEGRPIEDSALAYWGIGTRFGSAALAERDGAPARPCAAILAWPRPTPTCAPTRPPSASISTPIPATSSPSCA